MDSLIVKNFGPIKEANVQFGDLTILVGPQASGKSIFLQLAKLAKDGNYIADTLNKYAYAWKNEDQFLERYFGEGFVKAWNDNTEVIADEIKIHKKQLGTIVPDALGYDYQNVFFIPAQRVLTLENGYPKPFNGFGVGDPFVIKSFSEVLRQYVESPQGNSYLSRVSRESGISAYRSIFYDGHVELDTSGPKKRFLLKIGDFSLPFMGWSSGQKEFMPLNLAFSMLMRLAPSDKFAYDRTVIIEEPEMGLHPNAIKSLIFAFLQMMQAGYKVILSTHSPMMVEFAWAVNLLKDANAPYSALIELLDVDESQLQIGNVPEFAEKITTNALNSEINTFYFDNKSGIVKNISSLDAFSEDNDISEWGGLSSFATRASEIVAKNIPL